MKNEGATSVNFDRTPESNENTTNKETSNFLDYAFVNFDSSIIYINNEIELNQNKHHMTKGFYLGISLTKDNILHLVAEQKKHYIIYVNNIDPKSLEFIFNHRLIKKICFNHKNLGKLNNIKTAKIVDLQFVFKILLLREFNSEKDMFDYFSVSEVNIKDTDMKLYNFIELAKKINIYVEKNRINKYLYLEDDVKNILFEAGQRGFPVDNEKYTKFITILKKKYMNLTEKGIDFKNKKEIFETLNKKNKYLSFYPDILKIEDTELYKDLLVYNSFKTHDNVNCKENNLLVVEYDTYNIDTFNIKESFSLNVYYCSKEMNVIEGDFKTLYLRILAELSRDKVLISKASEGKLLDYIGKQSNIEDKNHEIIINIFLEAYANEMYNVKEIARYSYNCWDTYIDDKDVSNINNLFHERMLDLLSFMKNFDGTDDEYARYNSKIFHPDLNLHSYILQIENLIYKTAINYIYNSIEDFNKKYKNNAILIGGIFNKKIVLLAQNEHVNTAIDILNRYMAQAYRRYIKNAKYLNTTEIKRN